MSSINKLITFLFFLFCSSNIVAEDSLINLMRSNVDTVRIDALLKLNNKYRNINLDTALLYLNIAKREVGFLERRYDSTITMRWQFHLFSRKALYFQETDQFDSAYHYYNKLETLTDKMQNNKLQNQVYNNIGALKEQQSRYLEALEYYLKALHLNDSINDPLIESKTLVNIGVIYYRQEEYRKSLEYYKKALPLKIKIRDRKGEALIYNNMGIVYYYLNNNDKVLESFKKSLNIYRQLGDIRSQAMPYYNIAEIYKSQNQLKKALYYYKKAHDIEMQLGDITGQAETLSTIGLIYIDLKKTKEAIRVQQEAVRLLKGLGTPRELADALLTLSTTYEMLKEYDLALQYFKQYKIQYDSLNNIQKTKEITKIKETHESKKKDRYISKLSKQKRMIELENAKQNATLLAQKRLTILSLTVIALVLFGLIMIYRIYKQKKLSNQLLEFKNKAISRKNDEISKMLINLEQNIKTKEVFLSNVTNELQTPLNIIDKFTNLLTNATKDEKHTYYLNNIKNSTLHLSRLIKNTLVILKIESGLLKLQYETVNLKEFIAQIFYSFKTLEKQYDINIEYSIDSTCPDFLQIAPLHYQQIIENLIAITTKHILPKKVILLTFSYTKPLLKLEIEDAVTKINSNILNIDKNTTLTSLEDNIVKRLTELQKGTISLEGSLKETFTLTILAEQKQNATIHFNSKSRTPSSHTKYKNDIKHSTTTTLNKFMNQDEVEQLINVQIPELLTNFNQAIRNKDWNLTVKQLEELRYMLERITTKEFKELLDQIEKECFTTRNSSHVADYLQKLTIKWDKFNLYFQKEFYKK